MTKLADDLLKGAEAAAEYLGINARTVYRMAETNEIPVIRKGGLLFFRKSELDASFLSDFDLSPPNHKREEASPQLEAIVKSARRSGNPSCSLNDLLALLQELHEPNPRRFNAFMCRVKHLSRLGLYGETKAPGRKRHYSGEEVLKALFAMELTSLGIPPQKAIDITHETNLFNACGEIELSPLEGRSSRIIVDMGPLRDAARRHLPQFFPTEEEWLSGLPLSVQKRKIEEREQEARNAVDTLSEPPQ